MRVIGWTILTRTPDGICIGKGNKKGLSPFGKSLSPLFVCGSFINSRLVPLDIQDRSEDRAKNISYAIVIRTVLVPAVITVLVSTLESLLEVVLILVSGNMALITISA